jgi:hypothetical protein
MMLSVIMLVAVMLRIVTEGTVRVSVIYRKRN